jgi:hypothetical protein
MAFTAITWHKCISTCKSFIFSNSISSISSSSCSISSSSSSCSRSSSGCDGPFMKKISIAVVVVTTTVINRIFRCRCVTAVGAAVPVAAVDGSRIICISISRPTSLANLRTKSNRIIKNYWLIHWMIPEFKFCFLL